MKRKSRRELVLEIYDREAMGEVAAVEIAIINRGLVAEFGEGGVLAPAEIARILIDEELPVRFDQVFNMGSPDDRFERLFTGVLETSTLVSAEDSLRRIDALCRRLERLGDKRGTEYARSMVLSAKNAARAESRKKSLSTRERDEQAEIAEWLTIWLRTPDLFDDWLLLRKETPEFKRLFSECVKD